jgi:hypothetical protein
MRKCVAIFVSLILVCMSISSVAAQSAPAAQPEANCSFYQETQHNLCAGFRAYWQMYGGVAVFGFPITEEYVENGMTVQYFERARFEWHPGEWPERFDVMLGLLGNVYASNLGLTGTVSFTNQSDVCPVDKSPVDCMAFPQTGHTVSGKFLDYWNANGGLAIFGYPISDQYTENGQTVQYFERQRMELHPENAGTPYEVLLGLLGNKIYNGPTLTVVAQGLNNPRGVTVSKGGFIYVAEAGSGGTGKCIDSPEGGQTCFGTSGAITEIAKGSQSQIATGLPSLADQNGMSATGPASVSTNATERLSAVIQGTGTPDSNAQFGDQGKLLAHLITVTQLGEVTDIADLGAYEAANNPDGGEINSDPYSVLDLGDKWIVADAGANDLLQVTADGTITTLAVFPTQTVDAPPFLQMPPGSKLPVESVPTSVTLGPDGAYYVGELTGFPFPVGMARVWRVVPGQEPTVYASGFTNIISVTFDQNGNLLVLEIAKHGLLAAESAGPDDMEAAAGALFRVLPDGTQHEIASAGLVIPGGVAVGPDGAIYVTNFGIFSGAGQLVRLDY